MTPDPFTLYLFVVLTQVSYAAIWGAVAYGHRTFVPARFWLASGLLIFAGGALLPLQGQPASVLVPAVVGNTVIIFGMWFLWLGLRRFHGLGGGWRLALTATGACAVVVLAAFPDGEVVALAYAVGQGLPMVLSAVLLLRPGVRSLGSMMTASGIGVCLLAHLVVVAINVATMSGLVPGDRSGLTAIAAYTTLAIVLGGMIWHFGYAVMTIDRLRAEIADLALVDTLTGVWNRRKLDEQLIAEHRRAVRTGRPFAVLLIDLDRFKSINGTIGHPGGDQALVHVTRIIQGRLRRTDVLARLGGDEFCVLMPDTTEREAVHVAEALVTEVRAAPMLHEGREVHLSLSIGVSVWSPRSVSGDDILGRADRALFAVKDAGRGAVALGAD